MISDFGSMNEHAPISDIAAAIYIFCLEEGYDPSLWLNMKYNILSSDTDIPKMSRFT